MNKLTVVLLNWKRPANVEKLVDSLLSQAEKPVIYLWDNCPTSFRSAADVLSNQLVFQKVDWYVCSYQNKQCTPRWWMAQQATTPYVMSFDDDLMPSDDQLLSDLVEELDNQPGQNTIIGAFGKVLKPSETYELCPAAVPGEECDIVLGRVMAMRTRSLRQYLNWDWISRHECGTVDDIVLSGMFHGKHRCSKVFENRLIELPDEFALCREEGHFIRREEARRLWF